MKRKNKSLLQLLTEGVKIDLQDPLDYKSNISNIQVSVDPIPEEQLVLTKGFRTAGLEVRYSLEANPNTPPRQRKAVMDVLKTRFDDIKHELTPILDDAASRLAKPDYIFFLDSSDSTSAGIANFFSKKFGVPAYRVRKNVFSLTLYLINWARLINQSEDVQQRDIDKVSKMQAKYSDGNITLKKDDFHYTTRKNLHSKYNVDKNKKFYPSLEDYINGTNELTLDLTEKEEVAIVDAIQNNKKILIVDDNIHSGNDMRDVINDIVRAVNNLQHSEEEMGGFLNRLGKYKHLLHKASKASSEELEKIWETLWKIKDVFRQDVEVVLSQEKKSFYIKQKFKILLSRVNDIIESNREFPNVIKKAIQDLQKQVQIYTLYSLTDEDVK